MQRLLFSAGATALLLSSAQADVIGLVDFDGTETGLVSYTNGAHNFAGAGLGTNAAQASSNFGGSSLWTSGDAFFPVTRADLMPNGLVMPFGMSDDSVTGAAGGAPFAADTLGWAGMALDTNGFFGVIDTDNGVNTGPISADFVFDITGASNLAVSADFAAMGDFEAADVLTLEADIDGGGFVVIMSSSVDELIDQTYMMDNAATPPVILNDPIFMNGTILNDDYTTITAPVSGSGSLLTLRYTVQTNGGSESHGFDNLTVMCDTGGGTFTSSCFGDGGVIAGCTDCPCGNNAVAGSGGGCLNTFGNSASLIGSGVPSVANDTMRFDMTGGVANAFAILSSGDNIAPNNVANPCFGLDSGIQSPTFDGLRCAVGGILRHGTRPMDAMGNVGATTNGWGPPSGPAGGLIAANGFIAGQTRHFQVIYREDAMGGCGTGLNTSQAVSVTFGM